MVHNGSETTPGEPLGNNFSENSPSEAELIQQLAVIVVEGILAYSDQRGTTDS